MLCCSVLQCVAVCCSVLRKWTQIIRVVCCSVSQCVAVCCTNRLRSYLLCVAVCCSVLQCVAVCCSVLHKWTQIIRVKASIFIFGIRLFGCIRADTYMCILWIHYFIRSYIRAHRFEWSEMIFIGKRRVWNGDSPLNCFAMVNTHALNSSESNVFVIRAPDWLLQPVLLDSTTSSCCCTFSSNICVAMAEQLCSNPWRNNFVEGKIWDHPSKMTQEWPKLGGGVIVWYK